ncbi:NAD(P)-binding protein [Pseudoalteromonas sp. DL2-H2.2]|uniref:UDP-galactopyranose/dTDP-fucopyranose mutase family protein n=1 Tax=Pseudoalteromonas sp. DL2-H2.2 TaxID=2908889 RepID=UPI001F476132|nr:UDP-galactopyranose mutase [Pseudoalteromonas sp. DL2-H2.2]MCF2908825.1 NAD(P)-binding protein [Pseudoalteromonas sp. DL2-H2.2]
MASHKKFLVIGAGFSGAVFAREMAESGHQVKVIDERNHVAGNCHTERDSDTNVMVHVYGPHIFNTSNELVWDYVNRFGEFVPFINRVKACVNERVYSMPINLHTINQFFNKAMSPSQAEEFIKQLGDSSIIEPQNFEEQALKMLGKELYEAFFKFYTIKQWGTEPKYLPASILKRLPVRFNYNDNYYNKKYQGIPRHGYTSVVENILQHDNISVELGCKYSEGMEQEYDHMVYTGPLDAFFNFELGSLGYRTVYWEKETHEGDFLGNAVINYPGIDKKYTRVHEHKHFAPWEEHEKTSVFYEFSKETSENDIPYYPKRLKSDMDLLSMYLEKAKQTTNVSFLGRLATYRYMDMEKVIEEAIDFAEQAKLAVSEGKAIPAFGVPCE